MREVRTGASSNNRKRGAFGRRFNNAKNGTSASQKVDRITVIDVTMNRAQKLNKKLLRLING